jgi:hypothetical protein
MVVDTSLQPGTILEGRYGVIRELSADESHRVCEGRQTNQGLRVKVQAKQQLDQVALEAHG